MPRKIELLVIHCTASKNGDSLFRTEGGVQISPVEIVDRWHRERGFLRQGAARASLNPNLSSIGYHWLIGIDGTRYSGRAASETGAHARPVNAHSLGICMVGTDRFTAAQWAALADVVRRLSLQYRIPIARDPRGLRGVCGHNEIPEVAKACPGFSVRDWIARGLQPLPNQILQA